MTHKLQIILLALLLPVFTALAQNPTEKVDGTTAATSVDGQTGATNVDSKADNTPTADDSLTISFLTCSPGEEIHRLYGHTALRIMDSEEDWAVNFGWFSFNTPNFVMKFILGLTDYSMAYQTMPIFIADLVHDDMAVSEQVLNLTAEEAAIVKKAMRDILQSKGYDTKHYNFGNPATGQTQEETILSANWIYRYNFLYDNCTTRAVDAIKDAIKACGEEIVFPSLVDHGKTTTQRTMIHEFTTKSPWYEFGQDLLLGPEVDEPHTIKALADSVNFLPIYAENFFENAQIKGKDGSVRPLVSETKNLTPFLTPQERHPIIPLTPLAATGIILAAAVLITMFQRKANRKAAAINSTTPNQRAWRIWGNAFDFTCWTLQGIVGILLVIMVGWSEHPAVGTNWLLLIFNPLFLLGIPARLMGKKAETVFSWFACLMAFGIIIVGVAGLQQIPIAIYPIALAIAMRAKIK